MGTKGELLTMLESRKGEYFSGAELAQALDVSRTAVWKAVNALRSAGYQIQAAQNRGYCLDADTDVLSLRGIQRNLEAHAAGCTLELVPCTASTNALVRERAAAGAPEGLVILANQQTRGRGRLGREFYSPPDTGLYMSLLLRPQEMEAAQAVQITTMAAVAAGQAIETLTGKTAQIKWVNDILLGGRKVCGILTEGSFNLETGKPEEVVVGIGFNVYPPCRWIPGGYPGDGGLHFPHSGGRGKEPAGRRLPQPLLCDLSGPGPFRFCRPVPGQEHGHWPPHPGNHPHPGAPRLCPGHRPGLPAGGAV